MRGWGSTTAVLLALFAVSTFPRYLLGQPASSREPQIDSGEAGLSKKEIRQKRRAERRARRRADREAGDDSGVDEEAEDAAEEKKEEAAEAGRARAVSKAAGMAESLKEGFGAGLESAAAMPAGGAEVSGQAAVGSPGAAPSQQAQGAHGPTVSAANPSSRGGGGMVGSAGGDPARPKGMPDYLLAARSGYAPALGKAGLRLSSDGRSLLRVSDGRPAEAGDLSRLKAAIEAMPAALALRPDFFSHISPEHFESVKKGFHEQPELADSVYRHVAPTEENRDLVHSQSCSKVSGGCNDNVHRPSYKKGEFVRPEDLERMWGALDKELAEDADEEGGVARLAGPRMAGKPGVSGGGQPSAKFDGTASGEAVGGAGPVSSTGDRSVSATGGPDTSIFGLLLGPESPVGGSLPGARRRPRTALVVGLAFAAGIALAALLRKKPPPDAGE